VATQTTNYETGDAAFAVDRRGVIVLWNQAIKNMLGHPVSTAVGQQCWKLLSGQDIFGNQYCNEHCPLREMAFRHQRVHGFKINYKPASEERKQFTISCLTIFNEPGHELLLHILRPDKETRKNGDNLATSMRPGSNQEANLTRRELEVLSLLAVGMDTRNIASTMHISVPTARTHVQHMLNKLGVHNRLEAVMLGMRVGLL
jgi:DNA-binding CsgD family transcriptional regulator